MLKYFLILAYVFLIFGFMGLFCPLGATRTGFQTFYTRGNTAWGRNTYSGGFLGSLSGLSLMTGMFFSSVYLIAKRIIKPVPKSPSEQRLYTSDGFVLAAGWVGIGGGIVFLLIYLLT